MTKQSDKFVAFDAITFKYLIGSGKTAVIYQVIFGK